MGLSELKRLSEDYGWVDWRVDKNGVRSQGKVDDANISFPADSWQDESFNEGGMGIWAEMRFEQILLELKRYGVSTIWEVGAGGGAVSIGLNDAGLNVVAVEPIYAGARHLAKKGLVSFSATLEDLSLPNKCLPAIGLFDVLEHLEKPELLLATAREKLTDSGTLAVTVPAHQWLFSKYDSEIGHFKRYNSADLRAELESCGFEVVSVRYLFSFLVPLAWVLRVLPERIGLSSREKSIEASRQHFGLVNKLSLFFKSLSRAERWLRVPMGLSLLCIARVKNQALI